MKLPLPVLINSLVCVGLTACATVSPTPPITQTPGLPAVISEPDDGELKTLAANYTAFPTLNTELRLSATHGGIMVRTHLETATMQAFQNKRFPLPVGSIAVKEGHQAKNSPIDRIYVMKKIKAYDPGNGDWFYAILRPDGSVSQKGKIQMCISCHAAAKDKDYLYGFDQ